MSVKERLGKEIEECFSEIPMDMEDAKNLLALIEAVERVRSAQTNRW